jgi:RHH-type proline utilization regulon transcriptional repressor/proline dehydrogenase/delta 1-pyrroline-5-carboxylate dehydrogenase
VQGAADGRSTAPPLRAAYRQEEAACIAERLRQAAPATAVHAEAARSRRG